MRKCPNMEVVKEEKEKVVKEEKVVREVKVIREEKEKVVKEEKGGSHLVYPRKGASTLSCCKRTITTIITTRIVNAQSSSSKLGCIVGTFPPELPNVIILPGDSSSSGPCKLMMMIINMMIIIMSIIMT